MHVEPHLLREHRSHIEGRTTRWRISKDLYTMTASENIAEMLTFTSTVLKVRNELEMIRANHKPVAGKRIVETYQVLALRND